MRGLPGGSVQEVGAWAVTGAPRGHLCLRSLLPSPGCSRGLLAAASCQAGDRVFEALCVLSPGLAQLSALGGSVRHLPGVATWVSFSCGLCWRPLHLGGVLDGPGHGTFLLSGLLSPESKCREWCGRKDSAPRTGGRRTLLSLSCQPGPGKGLGARALVLPACVLSWF